MAAGGGVPGRFERIDAGQPFTVVVDYAHKPDAVRAALESLRPLTDGRLIVVLGAGGDRDPGKRPLMGDLAARLADVVVVTDDNPRTERPGAIRAAVLEGARAGTAQVLEEGDRRAAIATALDLARPGDIVRRRRQGARDRSGGRRGGAPLRRPRGGARAAGDAATGVSRLPVVGGPRRTRQRRTESWPSGPGPDRRGGDESHPAQRRAGAARLSPGHPRRHQPVPQDRLRPADPRRRPDQPPHQDGHPHHGRGRGHPGHAGRLLRREAGHDERADRIRAAAPVPLRRAWAWSASSTTTSRSPGSAASACGARPR